MAPFRRVGVAVFVLATWSAASLAADCRDYRLFGVGPRMTYKEVSRLATEEGVKRTESGRLGTSTALPFRIADRWILVRFAGEGRLGSEDRVLAVRTGLPDRGDELSRELEALRGRFGEPDAGLATESAGLDDGPVVWVRPECGLVVSAYRKSGSWWQPADDGSFLQIESLTVVRSGASLVSDVVERVLAESPATTDETPRADAVNPELAPGPTRAPEVAAGGLSGPASSPSGSATTEIDIDPAPPDDAAIDTLTLAAAGVLFAEPVRTRYIRPRYPEVQRRFGRTGRVELSVVVREDGTVGEITVVDAEPAGVGFEDAAVRAVRRWRYRPGLREGRPSEATVQVVLEFE